MKILRKIKNIKGFERFFKDFFSKNESDFEKIKEYETRIRGEYNISKEQFLDILKTELNEDKEQLQKYFNSFYCPMSEINNPIFELRGEYVQCCDTNPCGKLTPGKRYKKVSKGVDWYVGGGMSTYTVINDEGKKEECLFSDFINLRTNKFSGGLKDIF